MVIIKGTILMPGWSDLYYNPIMVRRGKVPGGRRGEGGNTMCRTPFMIPHNYKLINMQLQWTVQLFMGQ